VHACSSHLARDARAYISSTVTVLRGWDGFKTAAAGRRSAYVSAAPPPPLGREPETRKRFEEELAVSVRCPLRGACQRRTPLRHCSPACTPLRHCSPACRPRSHAPCQNTQAAVAPSSQQHWLTTPLARTPDASSPSASFEPSSRDSTGSQVPSLLLLWVLIDACRSSESRADSGAAAGHESVARVCTAAQTQHVRGVLMPAVRAPTTQMGNSETHGWSSRRAVRQSRRAARMCCVEATASRPPAIQDSSNAHDVTASWKSRQNPMRLQHNVPGVG